MDIKFMQDLHNKEFSLKESLAQRASTIIAGITTLGGLLAFVTVNFKPGDYPSANVMFWILEAASCTALVLAAGYLIWSYRVQPLTDIAKPKEWLSYWNDLQKQLKERKITSAETEFTNYLLHQYAEVGEGNIDSNFKRGTRMVKSNNALLTAFVLIVLTSFIFYINNYIFASPSKTLTKETREMLTDKNALVCVPVENIFNSNGGNGPKPRPVPNPGPNPDPNR